MSDCPICMETIEETKNFIVTECGHRFHCNCLMQNAAHNGFGCPYCRTVMAEEPVEDEDDDEDDYTVSDYSPEVLTDNELASFRMFHQRLEQGVEEQEQEEEEEEEQEEEEQEEEEQEEEEVPDSEYMAQKLNEKGVTYEDLVKCLLWAEHSDLGSRYENYERRSNEVYGQIKKASRRFERQRNVRQNETVQVPETVQLQYESGRIETLQLPRAAGITLSENIQSVLIENIRPVRNIQSFGRLVTDNEA